MMMSKPKSGSQCVDGIVVLPVNADIEGFFDQIDHQILVFFYLEEVTVSYLDMIAKSKINEYVTYGKGSIARAQEIDKNDLN